MEANPKTLGDALSHEFPLAAIMCNTQKKCKVLSKQSAKSFHLIFENTVFLCISTKFLGVHLLKLSQQLGKYRNTFICDDIVHRRKSQRIPFPLSVFKPVVLLR